MLVVIKENENVGRILYKNNKGCNVTWNYTKNKEGAYHDDKLMVTSRCIVKLGKLEGEIIIPFKFSKITMKAILEKDGFENPTKITMPYNYIKPFKITVGGIYRNINSQKVKITRYCGDYLFDSEGNKYTTNGLCYNNYKQDLINVWQDDAFEEGAKCKCGGTIVLAQEPCYCNATNAPCSNCESSWLQCNECGSRNEEVNCNFCSDEGRVEGWPCPKCNFTLPSGDGFFNETLTNIKPFADYINKEPDPYYKTMMDGSIHLVQDVATDLRILDFEGQPLNRCNTSLLKLLYRTINLDPKYPDRKEYLKVIHEILEKRRMK